MLILIGTFATTISHEIFAQQPQDAFSSAQSKQFMRKNFWLYLFNGSQLPRDANPEILDTINAMIEYLRKRSSKAAALNDKTLREILCKAASRTVSLSELGFKLGLWQSEEDRHEPALEYMRSYSRPVRGISASNGSFDIQCILAAVSAIGDDSLLKKILARHKRIYHGRSVFGDIITNSFVFNCPGTLAAFSEYLDGLAPSHSSLQASEVQSLMNYPWEKLVIQAMEMRSNSWVKLLLEFFLKHCPSAVFENNRKFSKVLIFAIEHCDSEAVANFLDAGSDLANGDFSLDARQFIYICIRHDEHVVLGVAKLLPPSGVNYVWRNSTPLTHAVKYGRVSAVVALLDEGADVNGRTSPYSLSSSNIRTIVVPIDEAIRRGKVDIIKALLDHNANAKHIRVQHRTKVVYNLLREAKMKQTGKYVPTYKEKYKKAKAPSPAIQLPSTVSDQNHSVAQAPSVLPYRQHPIAQNQLALPDHGPPAVAAGFTTSSYASTGIYAGGRVHLPSNPPRSYTASPMEGVITQNPFAQRPSVLPGYLHSTPTARQSTSSFIGGPTYADTSYYSRNNLAMFYPASPQDEVLTENPFAQPPSVLSGDRQSTVQHQSVLQGYRLSNVQLPSTLPGYYNQTPGSRQFTQSSLPPASLFSVHPGYSHLPPASRQLSTSYTGTTGYTGGHPFENPAMDHPPFTPYDLSLAYSDISSSGFLDVPSSEEID